MPRSTVPSPLFSAIRSTFPEHVHPPVLIATRDRAMIREIRKAREALSLSVAQPCELGGCEGAGTVVDLAGVEAHGYEWVDGWMDGWMDE